MMIENFRPNLLRAVKALGAAWGKEVAVRSGLRPKAGNCPQRYRGNSHRYSENSHRYRGNSHCYRGNSHRYCGNSRRYRENSGRYRGN
ncbi:hypothetical protein E2C01_100375 [Portunus trituberculatus]|uniref:Uncharacterized protein n=1 Tax=Portunus trituberculatus TaxID=210409 RepID=A0A5B7KD67_PORTR|nr:hypothetical protein [Portunus trituberculatus]